MKTTIKVIIALSIILLFNTACQPLLNQEQPGPSSDQQNRSSEQNYKSVIESLAALQGRAAGSKYEKKAASTLAREFAALDLEPLREGSNFYFQPFYIPERAIFYEYGRLKFKGVGPSRYKSQNVVGILPGASDQIVIISAHYDGQGINNKQIYPSANDNLSGIAALLEVAKTLKNREKRQLNLLFIAFGAEEMGLYGSEYFVNHLPYPKEKIIGVINLDTVGTNSGKMLIESTKKSSLVETIHKKLLEFDLEVTLDIAEKRSSDHYPFGKAGIDSLSVMAADWMNNNHTTKDTLEMVNFKQVRLVAKAISDAVLSMDEKLTE